jgi:hypothetical protein
MKASDRERLRLRVRALDEQPARELLRFLVGYLGGEGSASAKDFWKGVERGLSEQEKRPPTKVTA